VLAKAELPLLELIMKHSTEASAAAYLDVSASPWLCVSES
jgi:DNA-binding protein Fis